MSIEKVIEAKKALDEALKGVKDKHLHSVFATLFEKYPDLESFSWTQYTPYFNDGDSCTFGVHDIDQVNGWEEYGDGEWEEKVHRVEKVDGQYTTITGPLYPAYEEAQKILHSIPSELLESVLGDHIRVTVTKEAITTEEESHD